MGSSRGKIDLASRLLATLAVASILVSSVIVQSMHGLSLSSDSASYISAARNLVSGRGLVDYTLAPLQHYGPGTSALLSVLLRFVADAGEAFRILNVVAALVIAFAGVALFARVARDERGFWLLALALGFATPLSYVLGWGWSEPAFLATETALLLLGYRYAMERDPSIWLLLGLIGTSWALVILRYAGFAFIGAMALAIVAMRIRFDGAPRASRRGLIAYGLPALLGPMSWLLRNQLVGGAPMGARYSTSARPLISVLEVLTVVAGWAIPGVRGWLGLIAVCGLVVLGVFAVRRLQVLRSEANEDFSKAVFFFGIAGAYLIFMLCASIGTSLTSLENRYLSPAFLPLLLGAYLLSPESPAEIRGWGHRAIFWAGPAWVVATAVVTLSLVAANTGEAREMGSQRWGISRSLSASTSNAIPDDAVLFSNSPELVYLWTGREPVFPSPRKSAHRSLELVDDSRLVAQERAGRDAYLLWIDRWDQPWVKQPEEIAELKLVEIERLDDGRLYHAR